MKRVFIRLIDRYFLFFFVGDIFIFKNFEILFNRIIVKIYKRKYGRYMKFPLFSFQVFVYTEVFISINIYLYLDATILQCEYKYRKKL